jgi:hypothetical protein
MDWELVDRRLKAQFREAPRLSGEGFWIPAGAEPIPLAPLLEEALTKEEVEEWGSFEDWPGNVHELIDESEIDRLEVLSCFWASSPGTSSADGLDLIGIGERAYLCFWSDWGEGHRALALLQPGFDDAVVEAAAAAVLAFNGEDFGVGIFGSPPTEYSTTLPDHVLEAAFEYCREHDEYGGWDELWDDDEGSNSDEPHDAEASTLPSASMTRGEHDSRGQWREATDEEKAAIVAEMVRRRDEALAGTATGTAALGYELDEDGDIIWWISPSFMLRKGPWAPPKETP